MKKLPKEQREAIEDAYGPVMQGPGAQFNWPTEEERASQDEWLAALFEDAVDWERTPLPSVPTYLRQS